MSGDLRSVEADPQGCHRQHQNGSLIAAQHQEYGRADILDPHSHIGLQPRRDYHRLKSVYVSGLELVGHMLDRSCGNQKVGRTQWYIIEALNTTLNSVSICCGEDEWQEAIDDRISQHHSYKEIGLSCKELLFFSDGMLQFPKTTLRKLSVQDL